MDGDFVEGDEGLQNEALEAGQDFGGLQEGPPPPPEPQQVSQGSFDRVPGSQGDYEQPEALLTGSGASGIFSGGWGRPPVPPSDMPESMRRMTSGIRGTRAPNWADVETELRQRTLTDFLRRMFDTLSEQHAALEQLKDAYEGCQAELKVLKAENEQKTQLLHHHTALSDSSSARLGAIENDLGMQRQEVNDLAHAIGERWTDVDGGLQRLTHTVTRTFYQETLEKKTVRQAVHEMALHHNDVCNVVRRERWGRLRFQGSMLADLNLKGVYRRFYTKWQTWAKMETDIRLAQGGKESMVMTSLLDVRRSLPRRYFQNLLNYVQWARERHRNADIFYRSLRSLHHMRRKNVLQRYYTKLYLYVQEEDAKRAENDKINEEKADITADISMKALLMRYFNKLLGKRNLRVQLRKNGELCDRLGTMLLNSLRNRYYGKLYAFLLWTRFNSKRNQQAIELNRKREEKVRRDFLHRWAHHAACVRRHLERVAVSRALTTKNEQRVRSEYYHLLSRFQKIRDKARDRHELENRFAEVARKSDNLGTQVDVGLKTLSNTNSVLNKLVDRLITVDEQLGHLEKDKVSRRELTFITDPSRHPEMLERPPPSPRRMTHNDPRTSPTVADTPVDRYVPEALNIGTTERQRELEAERERDLMVQRQQTAEMEENHRNLQRIVAAMPVRSQEQTPQLAPQRYPQDDSRHDHPQITPFRSSQTPSTQFDFGDLQAELEQEQMAQRARYRSMSDVTSGRFV
eukprot:TRINITY_DN9817_c0_g1_i1.p1 TRINITY_DN9817_c0_g1~~TRINITY_DN9817_c0_g1_i1.p1  ORF type:complete len:767 (+),score=278.54 TRINITY_DN9817_c0_g1_i1:68-2302(+)